MRRGWRWPLAGVVGLAIAVGLFMIPALGNGPITGEVGILRLQMDSSGDRFTYVPTTGPTLTQTLTQSSCKLGKTLTSASLVSVVGSLRSDSLSNKKPYAGLKDHRIGVGQNGEGTGEPCARINRDLDQVLTLRLDKDLPGLCIGYAEIDLGFKFNGSAIITMKLGSTVVDTVEVDCTGSDCGPDSGGSDNIQVILDPGAVFDTIVIEPGDVSSNGAISLEGGLGGTGGTLFRIVETFDGEIDCGDTATLGGGDDPTFQITRGNDTNGGCKGPVDGLLYNFESGIEGGRLFVDFVTDPVDTNSGTVAQFLEEITWTFDDPPAVPGQPQVPTLSYDDHVGAGERVMPWCLTDPRPLSATSINSLPAGHTSCLIQSTSRVTLLGDFVKVDIVYNVGDGKRWN